MTTSSPSLLPPESPFAGPSHAMLDAQQLATVRAAVEWYFQSGLTDYRRRPRDIEELATACGACDALDDAGLVQLLGLLDDARKVTFPPRKAA